MTNPNECWIWTRATNKRGYGKVQIAGKDLLAHRVSYALFNGKIKRGQVICHRCDNPPCINPKHLFAGSQSENIRDAFQKGRKRQDREHNACSKLTEIAVQAIRDMYATGDYSQRDLAKRFGVTQSAVWCVLKNRSWSQNVLQS